MSHLGAAGTPDAGIARADLHDELERSTRVALKECAEFGAPNIVAMVGPRSDAEHGGVRRQRGGLPGSRQGPGRRPRRDHLPREPEQQGRSQRLHVRPHALGLRDRQAGELTAGEGAVRRLPRAGAGGRRHAHASARTSTGSATSTSRAIRAAARSTRSRKSTTRSSRARLARLGYTGYVGLEYMPRPGCDAIECLKRGFEIVAIRAGDRRATEARVRRLGALAKAAQAMPGQIVVGLDVGTSSVKAVAITADGAGGGYGVGAVQAPHPSARLGRAGPRRLVAGDQTRSRAPGRRTGGHRTHGPDARTGVSRSVATAWCGRPSSGTISAPKPNVTEIERRLGLERLVELTGNRALTGFTAPKLLWMRKHEPDLYREIARICLPKDYVRLKLTGEHAIDVSDASGTLLFDVAARKWSDEILDALEMPGEWLPQALESQEVSGRTQTGVPVAAGAGDQAAGALGVGVVRTGAAVGGARHLGGRVLGPRRVRLRPAGEAPCLLPRGSGYLARDGSHAVGGRLAELAPRCARRFVREAARRSRGMAAGV